MNTLRLVLATIAHRKARAVFTIGSVTVAFLLFGLLLPLERVFNSRVDLAAADRLIVTNKTSMMRPLPVSYGDRIGEVDGVDLVSHFTFFGAYYQDPGNEVAAIATDIDKFSAMVDEVVFKDPASRERWLDSQAGIAVGRQLAERLDWKLGDLVPVYSSIYQRSDGSPVWTFRVEAIFDGSSADANTDSMVINYEYFNRVRAMGHDTVGWYSLRVADAERAAAIAGDIDALFANSPDQTRSTTERAFAQSFLRQVGDFGAMVAAALALVFYTLVLVTANTMAQSVRERFSEIGVLKTLGWSDRRVFGLVVSESLVIMLAGGALGLSIAAVAITQVASRTDELLSLATVEWADLGKALVLMLGFGVLVAVVPAWRAARQGVAQSLGEAV